MKELKENIEKKGKLRFFNEAVEYINKFDICNTTSMSFNSINNSNNLINTDSLREEMLTELDYLKDLIINNPDIKISKLTQKEKEVYNNFIKYFSYCPVCGNDNHYYNLKHLYFDDKFSYMKNKLIDLMYFKKKRKFTFIIGIPCCNCYKKLFE